jgi:hypothetical protein
MLMESRCQADFLSFENQEIRKGGGEGRNLIFLRVDPSNIFSATNHKEAE